MSTIINTSLGKEASLTGGGFSVTIVFPNGKYEISNALIKECYFIEDIFSPFIYGKITFVDTNGIMELGPVTGNETVIIKYSSTGEANSDVVRYFYVYKIEEITQLNTTYSGGYAVELHLIDTLYSVLGIKQYSRSWDKETYGHDIVKHIITKIAEIDEKFIDTDLWEDTNEKIDYFYMPWWTCIDTIKWLMKRMSGSKSQNSGYVFYATSKDLADKKEREGASTLVFCTLDSLLSQNKLMKITNDDSGLYTFSGTMQDQDAYELNRVASYTLSPLDKNSLKGLAGGHYYGFDNSKKSPIDKSFTYSDMIDKHTILGKTSLFEDISEESASRFFTGEQNETFVQNISYDDWIKRYIMQQYIIITVQGHEKRYCGGLINIKLPTSLNSETGGTDRNEFLSGTCLVKSITHWFSPLDVINYRQKMVLIKNGLSKECDILLKASKSNEVS